MFTTLHFIVATFIFGQVRQSAASALGAIGDTRAVEPLILAALNGTDSVRRRAVEVLGETGDARAVEPLILALNDIAEEVRQSAASALEKTGTTGVKLLSQPLKDKEWYIHEYAVYAQMKIGDVRRIESFIQSLKDEDEYMRSDSVESLVEIGKPVVEPLILALNDTDRTMRRYVAYCLSKIGDARAVEPLILALNDTAEEVRQIVASALGAIGDARAVEPLILALNDTAEEVRQSAARALGDIGDAKALPELEMVVRQGRDINGFSTLMSRNAVQIINKIKQQQ